MMNVSFLSRFQDLECCICHENFKTKASTIVKISKCACRNLEDNNVFHQRCITDWWKNKTMKQCLMCQGKVQEYLEIDCEKSVVVSNSQCSESATRRKDEDPMWDVNDLSQYTIYRVIHQNMELIH